MSRPWTSALFGILLPVLPLIGCDRQDSQPFSVEVRVETQQGEPVQNVSVGVRPCYEIEGQVRCDGDALLTTSQQAGVPQQGYSVELTSWDVESNGDSVLLRWATASETDNAGFRIERRTDFASSFIKVGFVDGQGTTSDTTRYTFSDEDLAPAARHTYRLIAVATDGTPNVVGEPKSVRLRVESEIAPPFPNPFRERARLRVLAGTTATLQSTLHTLDGTKLRTLVESTVALGRHALRLSPKDLPDGLYELRTRLRADEEIAARDTSYAALIRDPSEAAPLGTTTADGRVSTPNRARFPGLFNVPSIGVRDLEGIYREKMRVSSTVQFVVTTPDAQQTTRRSITEGKNAFTLSFSP